MSYTPVVSGNGLAGWSFLKATRASQQRAFDAGPQIRRDSEYFAKTIAGVKSAEELVADRRLRNVALAAYGLQDDIDNRFFIRKILEEGTTSTDALANRLAEHDRDGICRIKTSLRAGGPSGGDAAAWFGRAVDADPLAGRSMRPIAARAD